MYNLFGEIEKWTFEALMSGGDIDVFLVILKSGQRIVVILQFPPIKFSGGYPFIANNKR